MFFSLPPTMTFEANVWSSMVITWLAPIANATFSMVNEGMTKPSFTIWGIVMLPAEVLTISNLTVSLAFSTSTFKTFAVEAPAKLKAPCICAIILPAMRVAKTRVKIFFINYRLLLFLLIIYLIETFG